MASRNSLRTGVPLSFRTNSSRPASAGAEVRSSPESDEVRMLKQRLVFIVATLFVYLFPVEYFFPLQNTAGVTEQDPAAQQVVGRALQKNPGVFQDGPQKRQWGAKVVLEPLRILPNSTVVAWIIGEEMLRRKVAKLSHMKLQTEGSVSAKQGSEDARQAVGSSHLEESRDGAIMSEIRKASQGVYQEEGPASSYEQLFLGGSNSGTGETRLTSKVEDEQIAGESSKKGRKRRKGRRRRRRKQSHLENAGGGQSFADSRRHGEFEEGGQPDEEEGEEQRGRRRRREANANEAKEGSRLDSGQGSEHTKSEAVEGEERRRESGEVVEENRGGNEMSEASEVELRARRRQQRRGREAKSGRLQEEDEDFETFT